MDFVQILGFIISLVAIFFLFFRDLWQASHEKKRPHEYAQEQKKKEKHLKQLLHEMEIDLKEELKHQPLPGSKSARVSLFQKDVVQTPVVQLFNATPPPPQKKARLKEDAYTIKWRHTAPSRGKRLISQLRSPRDFIILSELLKRRD
ncbi:MAG: hypothetical protein H0X51_09765 [Parachlamydiaceae bacterium]|nr:hypothetical protein [Parachlamydiaceae bacterium]